MKQILLASVAFFSFIFINTSTIYAQDDAELSAGGYTIEGIPNPHQTDPTIGYFDLHESPGEKDQLKVKLINQSTHEKKLSIKVTNGNTNSNGLVDYTGKLENHHSLKVPLNSILFPSQETVTIPPNSEKETILNLTMPPEQFAGVILGGIQVSDVTKTATTSKKTSINNQFIYTLGVVLKNDPKTETFKNVSVALADVQSKLIFGKKVVEAKFLNENPYIFGKSTVQGTITNAETRHVIQEEKKENVTIAPQSIFPFQFDWKKKEIKPGNYIFDGTVKTKDNVWRFSKKFTITEKQAEDLNKKTVFKIFIPDWLTASSIGFALLMIITSLWTVYLTHKKEVS